MSIKFLKTRIRAGGSMLTMAAFLAAMLCPLLGPLGGGKTVAASFTPSPPLQPILRATGQSSCTPAPTMTLLAPLGGEILDAHSSFNIAWTLDDPAGAISSVSIMQSTNGGGSFTQISSVPASQTQYTWTVPSIANNANVQIELLTSSNTCNVFLQLRSGNLMVFNPGKTFSHSAEAPIFFSGPGFTSTLYLANTSTSAITVELDPHSPNGNATQNFPTQLTLNAGASATVDAASLYTIGSNSQNASFKDGISGGIRLRHNGSKDSDVHAYVVSQNGSAEKFTTPFVYPASGESSNGTMQCAPMYYVDPQTSAYVAFQNATNSYQAVALVCNWGTGAAGTSNGQFKNQTVGLGPQQTYIVDLKSVQSQFGGTEWGSMDIFTSNPQAVVCHSVMMSGENGVAWDCPFIDPAMSVNTTKVADSVMLDYNTAQNAYIMLCNMATASRSVTASFNSTNGVSIPSVVVTVPAGGQKMITLNAQQLLAPGSSTTADVRLSYTGSPADITAAGCSLGSSEAPAVPVKFKEPSMADGHRIMSPYFRFDSLVSGKILISNLGSSTLTAGAKMVFANSAALPLKTAIVSIPAGGVGTIDLSSVDDGVPDGVASVGRVDLIHNGTPGMVTAAVSTLGYTDNSGQVVPLDPGPPADPVTVFPQSPTIQSGTGGCVSLDAITDGTVPTPAVFSTSTCFQGPVALSPTGQPDVYHVNICGAVSTCPPQIFPIGVGGGDSGPGPDLGGLTEESVNFCGISTGLGKRINPDGTTEFTICSKNPLPTVPMQVDFIQSGQTFSVQVPAPPANTFSISAVNYGEDHTFLGAVGKIKVFQLDAGGNENRAAGPVIAGGGKGIYFALDPPTQITSITNATSPGMGSVIPATGAQVNITGTGFKNWQLINSGVTMTVNPTVEIGRSAKVPSQIPFTFISLNSDGSITGLVGVLPSTVGPCCGGGVQTPCKAVTVINPGSPIDTGSGTAPDQLTSDQILSIEAPPPPVLKSASPGSSNSLGFLNVSVQVTNSFPVPVPVTATINGSNLFFVQTVNFGTQGTPIAVGPSNINSRGTAITVNVPPFCLTGNPPVNSNMVPISVADTCNASVSLANAWTYFPTIPVIANFAPVDKVVAIVGPCEVMSANTVTWTVPGQGGGFLDSVDCSFNNPLNASCAKLSSPQFPQTTTNPPPLYPGANVGTLTWGADCKSNCRTGVGNVTGFFKLTITNTTSGKAAPDLCLSASCSN